MGGRENRIEFTSQTPSSKTNHHWEFHHSNIRGCVVCPGYDQTSFQTPRSDTMNKLRKRISLSYF